MSSDPLYASEGEWRKVLVSQVDIDAQTATCINLTTGGEFPMPTTTTGYDRPRPGDAWLCRKVGGLWTFGYLMEAQVRVTGLTTAAEVIFELSERGSVPWRSSDRDVPEVPFWAAIGERRLFQIRPDDRWLKADGTTYSRARYPSLYSIMSSEGWSLTNESFVVPFLSDVDTASWYVCAE